MHEHQGTDVSQDIYSLVQLFLKTGQDSGLAEKKKVVSPASYP